MRHFYQKSFITLGLGCIICGLVACSLQRNKNQTKRKTNSAETEQASLLTADSMFSALSAQKGLKEASMTYMDSNGILLKPYENPIIGADAVDYISTLDDKNCTFTWQPKEAVVAASGDLGFTYGTYKLVTHKDDSVYVGTYVNIWKKDKDGNWKYILESKNDGLNTQTSMDVTLPSNEADYSDDYYNNDNMQSTSLR